MKRRAKKFRRAARLTFTNLLLVTLLLVGTGHLRTRLLATEHDATSARERRLAVFDDVSRIVYERYYDPALRGVDWISLGERLRPLAADAESNAEFYGVLRRMIDSLGDSHTRVHAPTENFNWRRPRFVHAGFAVREIDDAIIVTEVVRRSEAERARMRAGDRIISIDGIAVSSLLERRDAEGFTGNTDGAVQRARAISRLFDGEPDSAVSIEFADRRGRTRTTQLRRAIYERETPLRIKRISDGVRVVRVNAFTDEIAAQIARSLGGELRSARALVLDLRANGGGDTEAMLDVLSWFLPAGQSIGTFTDRHGATIVELRTRAAMLSAADRITHTLAPVVILTSARTASAAEIFVAALQDARRARVVGEQTCGCVLGTRRSHTLPDGGTLDVSELNYRTTRGVRLESIGITPDEQIMLTRFDLYARRDAALVRAAELLSGD